jgi:hypothetical protein
MTKSSVNFKAVKSASHAVSHASRSVEPTYLLPEGKSLGTICLLDDRGNVASVIEAKMALASRQALRQGDYSPVWEGVINLPRPGVGCDVSQYKRDCKSIISEWCQSYQKMTGHTVLRADIHLDEGHVVDGETLLNAHAHVICDKTNEKGRVLKINAPELRKIQDMTAKVTGLDRGESSLKTGRKHIDHQAYKYLAERGRLETQQQVSNLKDTHENQLDVEKAETARIQKISQKWSDDDLAKIKDLKKELAEAVTEAKKVPDLVATISTQAEQIIQINERSRLDREALKASGTATQKDYQDLKKSKDEEIATLKTQLKTAQVEAAKVPALETKITQQAEAFDKLKTDAMAVITPLRTEVKTMKTQITQLETDKLEDDKTRFADMAKAYQEGKAAGTPAHLIVPSNKPDPLTPVPMPIKTPTEQPKTPNPDIPTTKPEKTLLEAFLELYAGVRRVALEVIDGCRLDAACGRVGLFSSHNRATGGRNQVLCEVPPDKVMPEVGQVFDSRARPGKGGLGD